MSTFKERSHPLYGRCWNSLRTDKEGRTEGNVTTPNGIVYAYTEPTRKEYKPYTVLRFARGGQVYTRTFEGRALTFLAIVRAAARFAREKGGAQ